MAESGTSIIDTLRGRIVRGIQAGTLAAGERLPSSRELATEFDVDYRLVIAAYKALGAEGLVELRPRGGVYLAAHSPSVNGVPQLPVGWLVEVLTQGLVRELPAPDLHEWLRRSVQTLRLRALVITTTTDQASGLCRELRDDFGLEAEGILAHELLLPGDSTAPVRRADLIVATAAHAEAVRALGSRFVRPVIVIDVRPELTGGDWALLLRRPVYVVVATPEFGDMLRDFYSHVPGIDNLHVVVFGRDDLTMIPEGVPTYVTQQVRSQLGDLRIRGRILPAARTISADSAREIFTFMVRSNIDAMSRVRAAAPQSG